jgi:plastocyanin
MKVALIVVAAALGAVVVSFGAAVPADPARGGLPDSLPQARPQAAAETAVIKGTVRIKGELPRRRRLPVEADPKCAAMHGKDPLLSEEIVADAAGNVQWAFVYVKEGLADQKFETPKLPALVEQKGCRFDPHVFGVMAGQEVKFKNGDPLMHIVHVQPKNNREFGFSQAKPGEERLKVFTNKELIRVFCDVHPWMVSWAHVVEHPFFSVTGPDGKYSIKGLPPGKYTLEVWHEKYKPVTQVVELKANDQKTVPFELIETQ